MHHNPPPIFRTEFYSKLALPTPPRGLAKSVLALSDRYVTRKERLNEIWRREELAISYLAYFLPLNWLRALSVIAEGQRLGFFAGLAHAVDFGSGPGTFHFAAREQGLVFSSWRFIESETAAQDWHERLLNSWPEDRPQGSALSWARENKEPAPKNSLGIFSYSLNELGRLPEWAFDFEALCLIEPSEMNVGRRLQELRQELMSRGFSIWAPCTHQRDCPLLTRSKTDWCHHRIHVELPPSVAEIEKYLPMKNATLTYSYLLARRKPTPIPTGLARVIGDTLHERGKIRQAVCRGPEREFLSWLTRHGEPAPIARGSCIEIPASAEIKGNEIRLTASV